MHIRHVHSFDPDQLGAIMQMILSTGKLSSQQFAALNAKLDTLIQQEKIAMSQLDDKIATLTAEATANTNAEKAALKIFQGIPDLIAAAVTKALAAGATPSQLQALTDLNTTLKANDDELAAAVVANTPAATP